MVNWFKKDPLIHGVIAFLLIPLILIFFITVFILYGFLELFNPNFIEYGPQVRLYKAKDCAEIDKGITDTSCFLAQWLEGMYRDSTKTLDKVVEAAANEKEYSIFKRLPILEGYPKKGKEWGCSVEGKLIPDNSVEIVQPVLYKCWPK